MLWKATLKQSACFTHPAAPKSLVSTSQILILAPRLSPKPSFCFITLLFFSFTRLCQFSSVAQSCPPLCSPMDWSTPGLPVQHQLPESTQTMSIESVMPFSHLTLCRPLLLLPSIFPSIRVFSKESVLRIRWPKYWSFSFNISPSKEYSGLISFRMDGLELLAVQGTLKSFLQGYVCFT